MAYKGKLIGALLGSFAGPMGSVLGGLIGHLYDMASEERAALPRTGEPARPSMEPDAISASQLEFLTSLIGLAVAAKSEVRALKAFFREHFPYAEEDQRLLADIIDETYLHRERLEIEALCRHFRGVSTSSGRRLLVRLLFKIAPDEEELIARIAGSLGLAPEDYRSLASEFFTRVDRSYSILGLGREASAEEIRSAYRRLAAECHPDLVSNLGQEFVRVAEEKFKLIQEAYEEIRRQRGF